MIEKIKPVLSKKHFEEVNPLTIKDNVFKLIGKDWMLITAGDIKKFNTMTASWGGLGVLWKVNVCYIVIRPSRYTFEFMEKTDSFTLSFFEKRYREALKFCGRRSGRDVDKIKKTGLTPKEGKLGIYFEEARLVMECKKMYYQDLIPKQFLDERIERNYGKTDYHRMYIGEVVKTYLGVKT
jgi:flavin reductase (DIM6/NTAB) family NADH-FMN oxidoreductase RutF